MSLLRLVPRTLGLIWRACPQWTLIWLVLISIEGLLPAVVVYSSRSLIDNLASGIGAGWSWVNISPVLWPAILVAGSIALAEIVQGASSWARTAQGEFIRDHIAALIHEKALAVDLGFYESPVYHDMFERVRGDLSNRPLTLLEHLGKLFQNSLTLLAMAALLMPYGPWVPCLLLLGTLPAFYGILRFNRRYHQWWEKTTPDRRRAQYYDMLLTHGAVAAELRLFALGWHFKSAYQKLRLRLRCEQLRFSRQLSLTRLTAGLAGMLVSGSTLLWMIWRAFQGSATLGDLALFFQAFQRGQNLLRSLLENLGQIYGNTFFLRNLFDFLALPSGVKDPEGAAVSRPLLREGIAFRQVAFRYPGSQCRVLQDLNLTIPAGQIAAIVGANGAGKSTLVKLLCRFYDPESGKIEIDGTTITDIPMADLRAMMTVLFQLPVPYQVTAAQNIAFGDLSASAGATELEKATRAAGAHHVIASLPQGYDTLLGKWFDNGVELSVGEWQKLALARAFFRRAEILILDEPTSALDSWAEADWFDRFRSLADGRTGIIITHRFTIARRADVIHVMDAGRIVESGTHDSLITLGGFYARAWGTQVCGQSSNGAANIGTEQEYKAL